MHMEPHFVHSSFLLQVCIWARLVALLTRWGVNLIWTRRHRTGLGGRWSGLQVNWVWTETAISTRWGYHCNGCAVIFKHSCNISIDMSPPIYSKYALLPFLLPSPSLTPPSLPPSLPLPYPFNPPSPLLPSLPSLTPPSFLHSLLPPSLPLSLPFSGWTWANGCTSSTNQCHSRSGQNF